MTPLIDRFVTVQLTLLSIVVALILEGLLGKLYDLRTWDLYVGIEALNVGSSALAMWVGFAYGIAANNKVPHVLDFLAPFGLLITLSLAVRFIGELPLTPFLLCLAGGSFVAATALWMDCRQAARAGLTGPLSQARLLTGMGVAEVILSGLAAGDALADDWIIALLAAVTLAQLWGIGATIVFWRVALAEALGIARSDANDYQNRKNSESS